MFVVPTNILRLSSSSSSWTKTLVTLACSTFTTLCFCNHKCIRHSDKPLYKGLCNVYTIHHIHVRNENWPNLQRESLNWLTTIVLCSKEVIQLVTEWGNCICSLVPCWASPSSQGIMHLQNPVFQHWPPFAHFSRFRSSRVRMKDAQQNREEIIYSEETPENIIKDVQGPNYHFHPLSTFFIYLSINNMNYNSTFLMCIPQPWHI